MHTYVLMTVTSTVGDNTFNLNVFVDMRVYCMHNFNLLI